MTVPRIPCLLTTEGLRIRSLPIDPAEREQARQFLTQLRPAIDFIDFAAQALTPTTGFLGHLSSTTAWGVIIPPAPIAGRLPDWLLDRLEAAHPDVVTAESFEVITDDSPAQTVSAEHVRRFQCESVLHAELNTNILLSSTGDVSPRSLRHRLLDHWGSLKSEGDPRGELLILEPYDMNPDSFAVLAAFCAKYGLTYRVTGASSHSPNSTLRIEVYTVKEISDVQ